jgi:hypothetical protein
MAAGDEQADFIGITHSRPTIRPTMARHHALYSLTYWLSQRSRAQLNHVEPKMNAPLRTGSARQAHSPS